ncbi:MAG: DUF502 domain-containing protein [Bacillota bacterium]|nr:DUF502 domain-containing protein [Bacillota bacterium]
MKRIKHLFIAGFLTLIPIGITVYLLYYLFLIMDNFLGVYIENILGYKIPGIGVAAVLIIIFFTGFIITNIIGVRLLSLAETLLKKLPLASKIYFASKQIVQAFSMQGKQVFNKVALIEYPRKGLFVVGFVTGEFQGEVQDKTAERLINVFVPTTPNPTSGMLVLVPDSDIIHLNMTVEDGLKLIISAGVVVPESIVPS